MVQNDLHPSSFLIARACLTRNKQALTAEILSPVNNTFSHLSLSGRDKQPSGLQPRDLSIYINPVSHFFFSFTAAKTDSQKD